MIFFNWIKRIFACLVNHIMWYCDGAFSGRFVISGRTLNNSKYLSMVNYFHLISCMTSKRIADIDHYLKISWQILKPAHGTFALAKSDVNILMWTFISRKLWLLCLFVSVPILMNAFHIGYVAPFLTQQSCCSVYFLSFYTEKWLAHFLNNFEGFVNFLFLD